MPLGVWFLLCMLVFTFGVCVCVCVCACDTVFGSDASLLCLCESSLPTTLEMPPTVPNVIFVYLSIAVPCLCANRLSPAGCIGSCFMHVCAVSCFELHVGTKEISCGCDAALAVCATMR